ncbi:molecular chaperone [Pseudomonas mosselii]|uniref:fimbrial biogenesis chaperone n=1 Tax=unclassified Pseudomonas TaxID=196821 RepID=UPI0020C41A4A|nr:MULTISPECIES: molecular chaperone [unclassified Pseudomonas]MCP8633655.1 molecular chaperone [Pseudomonas sp. DVZ6]MDC0687598.1 molecular chaperone [Mitsuaria sp. RG]MDD7785041.1 molecular chaperone [Pseudomonas sp. DVZ24]
MLHPSIPACLGLLGLLLAGPASASISLSATRVVFQGAHKEANINVRNGKQEVLVQSWIDSGEASGAAPFAVTPPLARILPGEQQLLRILYEGKGLSTDKESVVWLNVQEIPQATTKANTLQLAVRQRIKVFFRPAHLSGDPLIAPSQLLWVLSGGELKVRNPTLFHVSMGDIKLEADGRVELAADSSMIAPGETRRFKVKQFSGTSPVQLTFDSINDYGAQNQYQLTVGASNGEKSADVKNTP